MRSGRLGGIDVPRIGLGTNRLSSSSFVTEAVAAGVRHIDTAHLYTGGDSEEAIGGAAIPEDCVVATKGGFRPGEGDPDVLRAQLEESFRRLRTDTIELYYLHRVDPETPLEQSIAVIEEYQVRGAIRHVGLSEVSVDQIERARRILPIAAVQNRFNLSERRHEDVVDYCEREGLAFVPFFPLQGDGGRAQIEIAERHRASAEQIALAWLLRRSPAMFPIPGTLSIEHLQQNLDALDIELDDAEYDALD